MSDATSARSRVGAVAWSLAFMVLGYVGMLSLAGAGLAWLAADRPGQPLSLGWATAIQAGSGILVYGLLTWAMGRRAMGLSRAELGWTPIAETGRGFVRGTALGIVVAVGAVALGLLTGSGWSLDGGTLGSYLVRLGILAVILLPPAFMEELAFRGLAVAGMARGIGRPSAIVVTSVLFAGAHWANPDLTGLALGNIALAGMFLALTFFSRGGIGTATGAHWGWNLALAGSAAPVSGLPFDIPWLDFQPGNPGWLTGGAFGPEGGLLATVALTAGAIFVIRRRDFREEP